MSLKRHKAIEALWKKGDAQARATGQARVELDDPEYVKRLRTDKDLFRDLIVRFQAKEPGVSDIILKAHHPMLVKIVLRYCRSAVNDYEDLLQVARLALLEGCARFESSEEAKGALSFIWIYVKSYVCRALADEGSVVKIPPFRFDDKRNVASEKKDGIRYRFGSRYVMTFSEMEDQMHDGMIHSFEETLTDDRPLPDETLDGVWRTGTLKRVTERLLRSVSLSKREVDILRARFEGQTLNEIGEVHRLSRERVRQIEREAMHTLQHALKLSESKEKS
jgi:RNA polymerase primary sigma factor